MRSLVLAAVTLALALAHPTLASPPTSHPTNVNKACEEISLKWACERRPEVCAWKKNECITVGTYSPTPPTTRSPTRKPTTRSPTRPTVKGATNSPTAVVTSAPVSKRPTTARPSGPLLCRDLKTEAKCKALATCVWVNSTCRKTTVSPTSAPSSAPTPVPPKCSEIRSVKGCCGAKFAKGKSKKCVNDRVVGEVCRWNAKKDKCLGTPVEITRSPTSGSGPTAPPVPTKKPVVAPPTTGSEYEYEAAPTKRPTPRAG